MGLASTPASLARLAAGMVVSSSAMNGTDVLHMAAVVMNDVTAVLALRAATALALAHLLGLMLRLAAGIFDFLLTEVLLGLVVAVHGRFDFTATSLTAVLAVTTDVVSAMNAGGGDLMHAVVLAVVLVVRHGTVPQKLAYCAVPKRPVAELML